MSDVGMTASAGRLLIIDDEPAVGTFLGRVARRSGYEAIVTADASDFKQRVRPWRPALIILDLGMPETDGIEMLRFLADERATARILIVSGFDEKSSMPRSGLVPRATLTWPACCASLFWWRT